MKKIIITENQYKNLNELFSNDYVYNVKSDIVSTPDIRLLDNTKTYNYTFLTKDKIKYRVMVMIREDGIARIDFDAISMKSNIHYFATTHMVNSGDAVKVFNTMKSIIDKHKSEIKELQLHSSKERNAFYKKLVRYFGFPYDDSDPHIIKVFLDPNAKLESSRET